MSATLPAVQLYTVPEVAQRLRISRALAWRLIQHGRLASLRIGRNRRVSEEQLLEFIRRQEAAG